MTSDGNTSGGKRRQLGRGLSSLLGDDGDEVAQGKRLRQTRMIAIESISPGASQPRRLFDEAEMAALAESIRERGVLQPILLRRTSGADGALEIIAGERRWRAAQIAGLHEIPALVREFSDTEALEIALIENIQRSDLTALEEADGFQRLIDDYGHTQEDVAQAVGKSRSHVANTLRLLSLPSRALEHLEAGRLSAGHARALLASDNADRLSDYVVAGGLSVRATERLVQGRIKGGAGGPKTPNRTKPTTSVEKDPDTRALERSLTEELGLTVDITQRDEDRGSLTIHYQSLDQLDDLLAKLTARSSVSDGTLVVPDVGFDSGETVSLSQSSLDTTEDDLEDVETSVDFDALMAQTASLLASGEAPPDIASPEIGADSSTQSNATDNSGRDPGANALISGLLSVLDADESSDTNTDTEAKDGLDEWENEVMAGIENDPEDGADSPAKSAVKSDPDEEIEFID